MSSVATGESMTAAHVFSGSHINLLITQTRLVSADGFQSESLAHRTGLQINSL